MYMQYSFEELCDVYDRVDWLWHYYAVQGAPFDAPYAEIKRRIEIYRKYDPVFQRVDEQRAYVLYLLGAPAERRQPSEDNV